MRMPCPITELLARARSGPEPSETVPLHGRPVAVRLTPAADDAGAAQAGDAPAADGRLRLRFRPVMSRHCGLAEGHQLTGFPLAEPGPFVPHWVRLDYRPGAGWTGGFGYATAHPEEGAA